MATDRATIIEQIKKLMAMAEHPASNPNEAAVAAAQATKLILKHNIEAEALEKAGKKARDGYGHQDLGRMDATFQRQLATLLARANFCQPIQIDVQGHPHIDVVGKPANIEVVDYLYHFMLRTVDRLAREDWKARVAECGQYSKPTITQSHHWTAFHTGAIDAIRIRLDEQRRHAQAEPEAMALIVVSTEELKNAVSSFYPALRNLKTRKISLDSQAYGHGYNAGSTVTPNLALKEK